MFPFSANAEICTLFHVGMGGVPGVLICQLPFHISPRDQSSQIVEDRANGEVTAYATVLI